MYVEHIARVVVYENGNFHNNSFYNHNRGYRVGTKMYGKNLQMGKFI